MPAALLLAALAATAAEPIRLHPDNPHYLLFQGKATLLVTSGEHYGAVLNLDFDHAPYLDELKRAGLNLTRTFSGTYREVPGSFNIRENTLAPKPNRYQAPWRKVADAAGRPERYDLDAFDPAYFERLNSFLDEAGRRGIVVELVLFCPFYEEILWEVNPMNGKNNVNNVGNIPREEAYTLKHKDLLDRQLAFVRKVVAETNRFDNLYYEICNEPYFGGVALDWQRAVAEAIVATEKDLPKKHLIAQNIANAKAKVDRPVHPGVSILNFHYADPPAALDNYGLNLALSDDETGFEGTGDRPYRSEAWLFLLSGGSIISNLDYSFTPDHEDGTAPVNDPTPGGGGRELRRQLSYLKTFVEGFDYLKMRPEPSLIVGGVPEGGLVAALVEPGRQYAIYLDRGGRAELRIDLPAGRYRGAWFDPRRGMELQAVALDHGGGAATLATPVFDEDIALRLVVEGGPEEAKPCVEAAPDARSPGRAGGRNSPAGLPRLKVSDNRRYLVREDGTPFFYLGDTAWELFHRLNREEAQHYLKDRAAKGFTVIQAVVLAEFDGLHTPNAYGDRPLVEDDPARPNEAYFRHVDFVVDEAERLGLYVGMLPTWGDKVNKKWGIGPEVFTPENARAYGEYLGRRYRDRPILWVLGGDRPVENDAQREIWPAMAEGLRAGDGGNHLITYHPTGGQTSADYYPDAQWLDFHMGQSGHARRDEPNYRMIARLYGREPTKPCLDGEPRYEDHPIDWKPENGWFDAHDVRKALYWSVFAGGCGVTYGCHDIWQFWQPGRDPISSARTPWREALELPAAAQGQHLRRLVESRPCLERVPDQSLIAGDAGSGGGHAQATRGSDGSYAFIYIPSGEPVTVNLNKLTGAELVAHWFDPRNGESREAGRHARTEQGHFQPPEGGPDWVLVLDDASRNYPAPGSR
jgi:hypothetical protein